MSGGHIPPLDPNVAASKGFRESEERIRRFWTVATVEARDGGWAVLLDGRAPKTPAGAPLVLSTRAAAVMCQREWAAQGEFLEPATLFATRLAATAIDRIGAAREAVADEIAAYAGSDLLCYLADSPMALVERQAREWAPWREWAAREQGLVLHPVEGVIHRPQPPESLARVKELALTLDDFALAGLAMATPLFGSAVLGLAVLRGALSGEDALALSRLDEAFQEEQWGVDDEAAVRTEARRHDAALLDHWFRALEP